MYFQRFTAADHGRLLQEIADVRADLAGAEERGDVDMVLELAATLGELLTTARDEAAAHAVLSAYLPLATEQSPSEATGWLLLALATANQYREQRAEARAQFADALRMAEVCGAPRLEHFVLHHWGRSLAEEGALDEAMRCFTRALRLRVALGEPLQTSTQRAIDALTDLMRPAAGGLDSEGRRAEQ